MNELFSPAKSKGEWISESSPIENKENINILNIKADDSFIFNHTSQSESDSDLQIALDNKRIRIYSFDPEKDID